jgi:hypothetical protein
MTRGVLMFAFNNGVTDYFEMAVRTAKRANQFLHLPVTVVTDYNTITENYDNPFDSIIIQTSDISNIKDKIVWINKGRHKAYELSPYDETLVLDTDYLINSDTLLQPFQMYDDFMCHTNTSFIMIDNRVEKVSNKFIETAWATVIYFKKTNRVKQIFECMEMIQNNYQHYINVFDLSSSMYRNDYSLTMALWIVNGHTRNQQDYIPWTLLHLNKEIKAYKVTDTEYVFLNDKQKYIRLKDTDFHLLDKTNFMELTNE